METECTPEVQVESSPIPTEEKTESKIEIHNNSILKFLSQYDGQPDIQKLWKSKHLNHLQIAINVLELVASQMIGDANTVDVPDLNSKYLLPETSQLKWGDILFFFQYMFFHFTPERMILEANVRAYERDDKKFSPHHLHIEMQRLALLSSTSIMRHILSVKALKIGETKVELLPAQMSKRSKKSIENALDTPKEIDEAFFKKRFLLSEMVDVEIDELVTNYPIRKILLQHDVNILETMEEPKLFDAFSDYLKQSVTTFDGKVLSMSELYSFITLEFNKISESMKENPDKNFTCLFAGSRNKLYDQKVIFIVLAVIQENETDWGTESESVRHIFTVELPQPGDHMNPITEYFSPTYDCVMLPSVAVNHQMFALR